MKQFTRRDFMKQSIMAGAGLAVFPNIFSCTNSNSQSPFRNKIVILGIDGMDPILLTHFIQEGLMPNFSRLIQHGSFSKIQTSIPPQSPVAWSDFAVGASAGAHGVFDFIHRDPKTMTPYLSTSSIVGPSHTISIGEWEIPLQKGHADQLREGKAFWEYLAEAEIPTTIFKMPGNFPVKGEKVRAVSGMGTPDLLGSYGIFSFYSSNPSVQTKELSGGRIFRVNVKDDKIKGELIGPENTLKKEQVNTKIAFTVWRDPQNPVVKIKIQDHELILNSGEWSNWIQLSFEMFPLIKHIKGICKLLIKQIHPHFEMYVSPINVDPTVQSLPVTSPSDYGKEIVKEIGFFGTKGLPADTKALSQGILREGEYLEFSDQIFEESRAAMRYELANLSRRGGGLLFFYYSNIDQDSHMFWRVYDRGHHLYSPEIGKKFQASIKKSYMNMDFAVGEVLSHFDLRDENFNLIIMSDHGFAPFNRSVNLNSWLLEKGYISLFNRKIRKDNGFFENVNWSKTKAYGLGINALYINKAGREREGTVPETEAYAFIATMRKELLELKDPLTHRNAISNVWIGKEIYQREDDKTPDLIIGWNKGYRSSWETVLGGFSEEVFAYNDDKWSGDHCIDPQWVPGILVTSKKLTHPRPALPDVTATILRDCNIPIPRAMTGKPIY
jgi:predicted AlkP superfamily phosphohydrolase/phosphomutase